MSSFLTERTAEYFLTPLLREALAPVCKEVVPMFYWKTREGNSLSLALHRDEQVRLVAMFARRPKLNAVGAEVECKINKELFSYGRVARTFGIVTVAALPVASSLRELYSGGDILLLNLDADIDTDLEFTAKNYLNLRPADAAMQTPQRILLEDLSTTVVEHSQSFSWHECIDQIRHMNKEISIASHWYGRFGFQGYRPVYFILYN